MNNCGEGESLGTQKEKEEEMTPFTPKVTDPRGKNERR